MVGATGALLMAIVLLSAEILFDAPAVWRTVTLHANAAILGVHSAL
jgi:hypothetical protein